MSKGAFVLAGRFGRNGLGDQLGKKLKTREREAPKVFQLAAKHAAELQLALLLLRGERND